MKALLVTMVTMFLTACAGHGDYVQNEVPAYWMKQYASADQAKINRCMAEGNAAYDKVGGSSGMGDNGWSVLAKGNAWEKCMEAN